MTKKGHILDAIKARFHGNGTLRRLGRVVTSGESAREHEAVTLVNMSLTETSDTFASDIEVWSVSLTFGSKSLRADDAMEWLDAVFRTFEDADIVWPTFACAGCRVVSQEGPSRSEELFVASAEVELIIERELNRPKTRNAVTV